MAAKSKRQQMIDMAVLAPLDWVDERTGAVRGTKWFLFRNVPRDISWMQTLGSAALTAFIVQALTGAILAMYYKPSSEIDPLTGNPIAYTSIQAITDELTLGWLVRGMHRWGASVFIILLFLHMGRVFLFGAYKYPRELQWITGVLILVMGMLMGFTGYLLPWDQTAYWATVVGINLNGTAPFAGPWLAQFLASGPEIGADTLPKWYALHMLLIPGALIALIGIHIYLVTRLGVSSPPWSKEAAGRERTPRRADGRARRPRPRKRRRLMARDLGELNREDYANYKDDVKKEGKGFFPFAMWHDTVMSLVVVCVITALAAIWYFDADGTKPGLLGPWYTEPADPGTTDFIPRPDWYFYFLFYLLRIFEWPETVFIATVGIPTICLILLLGLPFYDRRRERRPLHRPVAMVAAVLTILSMAVLTWKGATAKEALGSELVLLVPSWAEEQGFADNPRR